ncbi:BglG family transcription antiterminator [Dellaglioa sp. L3N]
MIDYRISYLISNQDRNFSLENASIVTGLPKDKLLVELQKVKKITADLFNCSFTIDKNKIFIPQISLTKWVDILFMKRETEVLYLENERQAMIYLLIFGDFNEFSVFHFQEFFSVSRNTILSDLRKIKGFLNNKDIILEYSRKKGYLLIGNESELRTTAYILLGNLHSSPNGKRLLYKGLLLKSMNIYTDVRTKFSMTIENFDLVFVPSRFEEMTYFISYLICRCEFHETNFLKENQQLLQTLIAYRASGKFLDNFPNIKNRLMECLYFTILFMTILQGEIRDTSLEFLLECASKTIHEVERLAGIEFQNYRSLLLDLFYHLVPAYFRIKFNFPLNNVLIEEIKLQYHEIFEITKVGLLPLRMLTQKVIPDEEIGYFTILFGGAIKNEKEKKQYFHPKALVLCPSGISSSLIMKSELQELFPQIIFSEISSFDEYKNEAISSDFDLIFSSVSISTDKKLYVINPIMSTLEKHQLMREVQEDFLFPKVLIPSVDEIIDYLIPHINLKKGVTKEKLNKIVQRRINKEMKRREDDRPMLSELLTEDMIQLSDSKMKWEEAISYAAEPLKNEGKIESTYVEAMINKVKDYGPFIHIGKGVALPHARPEDGVNELGMSMLKVKEPVFLLDDERHPIKVFICLAAIDNENHLKALASLTKILSNKDRLEDLLEAKSKEEILNIINKGENE